MVKQTVKYKDLNGTEREETFYFHLSKANLIELEAKHRGGLKWYLERIAQEHDTERIWGFLSEIVMVAFGQRSPDGSRLIKNDQLREDFQSSEAYSEFMMGLLQDPAGAAEFINNIIPHDMRAEMAKAGIGQPPMGPRPEVSSPRPAASEKDWNVFEGQTTPTSLKDEVDRLPSEHGGPERPGFVPTESMAQPPEGALSDKPAAEVLTEVRIREMDPVELQRGLVEGRYKLP